MMRKSAPLMSSQWELFSFDVFGGADCVQLQNPAIEAQVDPNRK